MENMRFRVVLPGCKEVTLNWNETIEVLESGEWTSIQIVDHELYPESDDE